MMQGKLLQWQMNSKTLSVVPGCKWAIFQDGKERTNLTTRWSGKTSAIFLPNSTRSYHQQHRRQHLPPPCDALIGVKEGILLSQKFLQQPTQLTCLHSNVATVAKPHPITLHRCRNHEHMRRILRENPTSQRTRSIPPPRTTIGYQLISLSVENSDQSQEQHEYTHATIYIT
jgi:hypothetical protein